MNINKGHFVGHRSHFTPRLRCKVWREMKLGGAGEQFWDWPWVFVFLVFFKQCTFFSDLKNINFYFWKFKINKKVQRRKQFKHLLYHYSEIIPVNISVYILSFFCLYIFYLNKNGIICKRIENICPQQNTCTLMFITALFIPKRK